LNPSDPKTYYNRANAYIAMKKNDLALKDLDMALDLD